MNSIAFSIARWAAWAPGLEDEGAWREWAAARRGIGVGGQPSLPDLPALFRRRLSRVSRMALQVALQCAAGAGPVRTVFCARHGELQTTLKLLEDLSSGEIVSPTNFSLSVHNTASGLYSIADKNHLATTALAAGIDTLEFAFIEAAGNLRAAGSDLVMVVIADEALDPVYAAFADQIECAYAAAFVLTPPQGPRRLRLNFRPRNEPGGTAEPHALALLRFLHRSENRLRLNGERLVWEWCLEDA